VGDVGRFRHGARPFDFAAGALRPGRYLPDNLDVSGAIEAIRFAPVEVGYGFDASGRQIFRQVGDEDGITGFARNDLARLHDGLFVHNHPPYWEFIEGDPRYRAGSFSSLDLTFMYECHLIHMIAVTRERTYFVQRRQEGFYLDAGQVAEEYAGHVEAVRRQNRQLVAQGIISVEEAAAKGRLADEVMIRLSDVLIYRREEAG
jgi:hypothetical protein